MPILPRAITERWWSRALLVSVLGVLLSSCQTGRDGKGVAAVVPAGKPATAYSKTGTASFYSNRLHGGPTTSGMRYNRWAMTAASHSSLPLGCKVRVTHLASGRSVEVLINDRMGHKKRIIDLSYAAASKLGMLKQGLAKVRVELIAMPQGRWRRG